MPEFRMPSLGADMEHGRLMEWLVRPGDVVHRGDVMATVDTDKALMDIESFDDGVVAELLVEAGTDVAVGTPLALLGEPATAGTPPAAPVPAPEPPPEPAPAPEPVAPPGPPAVSPAVRRLADRKGIDLAVLHGTGRDGHVTRTDVERAAGKIGPPPVAVPAPHRVRSSPRARRVAQELAVDLPAVHGTGPAGAVVEADVRAAATPAPAAPAPSAVAAARPAQERPAKERSAAMRKAIGALMARSKKSIPHYYLSTTIDLRAAQDWMRAVNAGRPVTARLVPAALLLKATARAAREVPEMNGFYADGAFSPSPAVHLGVAVALRKGGLVAPAMHDADTLALDEVMAGLRDLVTRARGGRLTRTEMSDPTLTVTNLGDLGVESVFGVIYPPQVALVGFGRVVEQPYARDGLLGVRPAVTATLSADHRVSDGLRGGRFLDLIAELLQRPEDL